MGGRGEAVLQACPPWIAASPAANSLAMWAALKSRASFFSEGGRSETRRSQPLARQNSSAPASAERIDALAEVSMVRVSMGMVETGVTANWLSRVRYHLVVIDLPNPAAFVERIKRLHPESSVIVISDHATIEEAAE